MAAGDRYNNGKPKDIVRHFKLLKSPNMSFCGINNSYYLTMSEKDVTCLRCLTKIALWKSLGKLITASTGMLIEASN